MRQRRQNLRPEGDLRGRDPRTQISFRVPHDPGTQRQLSTQAVRFAESGAGEKVALSSPPSGDLWYATGDKVSGHSFWRTPGHHSYGHFAVEYYS